MELVVAVIHMLALALVVLLLVFSSENGSTPDASAPAVPDTSDPSDPSDKEEWLSFVHIVRSSIERKVGSPTKDGKEVYRLRFTAEDMYNFLMFTNIPFHKSIDMKNFVAYTRRKEEYAQMKDAAAAKKSLPREIKKVEAAMTPVWEMQKATEDAGIMEIASLDDSKLVLSKKTELNIKVTPKAQKTKGIDYEDYETYHQEWEYDQEIETAAKRVEEYHHRSLANVFYSIYHNFMETSNPNATLMFREMHSTAPTSMRVIKIMGISRRTDGFDGFDLEFVFLSDETLGSGDLPLHNQDVHLVIDDFFGDIVCGACVAGIIAGVLAILAGLTAASGGTIMALIAAGAAELAELTGLTTATVLSLGQASVVGGVGAFAKAVAHEHCRCT